MSVSYRRISEFDFYLEQLKKDKKSFLVEYTTYTRKVKKGKDSIIFNKNGDSDFSSLCLINKAKSDAKKYVNENRLSIGEEIGWFNLFERPPITEVSKIDIRSAYWQYAINNKIISEKTDSYLNENFSNAKQLKEARLRALGSLATIKIIHSYVDGEEITSLRKRVVNEKTRELYIEICRGVDGIMKDIVRDIPGAFYYYWDCVFATKESSEEIVNFLKDKNYSTKTESTEVDIVNVGNHKYIFTTTDEKMYIIKPEQTHLLNREKIFINPFRVQKQKEIVEDQKIITTAIFQKPLFLSKYV